MKNSHRIAHHFVDRIYEGGGKGLFVGIDPHLDLIPECFLPSEGTLDVSCLEAGIIAWMEHVLAAARGVCSGVKFQSAFFEQFGSVGSVLLARGIARARAQGLVVLLDAKRGDIGSTAHAYASYLRGGVEGKRRFETDLEADALTVSPFMGDDTLEPFLEVLDEGRKGIFVLLRTSNPGSARYQTALVANDVNVAQALSSVLTERGRSHIGACGFSSVGAVVGATQPRELEQVRAMLPHAVLLVPGIGAQGGSFTSLAPVLDSKGRGALVAISRGITFAPSDGSCEKSYQATVRAMCERYREELERVIS